MSEEIIEDMQEAKQPTVLEQLKAVLAGYVQQREIHQSNLNQIIGAIYATEMAIEKIHNDNSFKLKE